MVVNNTVADDLAPLEARASAVTLFTWLFQNILINPQKD